MAHLQQSQYCEHIKSLYPEYFHNKTVLDVGSLDVNGNNRYLFTDCYYVGLDIGPGPNVNIVSPVHLYNSKQKYDVIISTEMLEHDKHWKESLNNMVKLLKPGGLLLLTAATTGRLPHGTNDRHPEASPFSNDYYRNVTIEMLNEALPFKKVFKYYDFDTNNESFDIYFHGIKKLHKFLFL